MLGFFVSFTASFALSVAIGLWGIGFAPGFIFFITCAAIALVIAGLWCVGAIKFLLEMIGAILEAACD